MEAPGTDCPAELPKNLTKKKDKRIAEQGLSFFHIALDCFSSISN